MDRSLENQLPPPPPSRKAPLGRDGVLLLASALVVALGAAITHRSPSSPATTAEGPSLPPPLPSGAAQRDASPDPGLNERSLGCSFPDRGFGDYEAWHPLPVGRGLIPGRRGVSEDGSFPLLVHFHGSEPVRKELATEGLSLVIVGVDAGEGSRAYEKALADPRTFPSLVAGIEAEVAQVHHRPTATARPIVLSSWSAGYGAVSQVVARPHERVRGVVLLDSLYAGYVAGTHTIEPSTLRPFVAEARQALAHGPMFFLTHTFIVPPNYASTPEVASFLLGELGRAATEIPASEGDPDPFPLRRYFESGHLFVRGYAGEGGEAHCAQVRLLKSILRETVLPTLRDAPPP